MEWYNIVLLLLGGVGGTAGLISIYKAKPEKTGLEIGNMREMLDEARKMFNDACEEKEQVQKEFADYKTENMKYIGEFKERFAKVEQRLDQAEGTIFDLTGAVYQGYRCKYPENIEDCPVIKEYEKKHCQKCVTKNNE
jgi:DNA-binding transcriptional MerR regulator